MAELSNPPCPECGESTSSDRKIVIMVSGIAIIVLSVVTLQFFLPALSLMLGIGMVFYGRKIPETRRYKCKSCSHKFGEELEAEAAHSAE